MLLVIPMQCLTFQHFFTGCVWLLLKQVLSLIYFFSIDVVSYRGDLLVVEWLSSWLAEHTVRARYLNQGLSTLISEIGHIVLPSRRLTAILLKLRNVCHKERYQSDSCRRTLGVYPISKQMCCSQSSPCSWVYEKSGYRFHVGDFLS